MRFISVTLRNCRVHRELKVDFDPARTLIGGPNETGKSTLIEALHRALFLKAKGSTEHHRALNSTLHTGHPEVELAFEARGTTYVLKKRFGTAGTVTLAPSNSVSLSGDAAESELARLLSVEAGIAGKAMAVQWAHLWVWQGQAGDDPSANATAQQAGLLQRLQQMGGAAALQSALDARVAKCFSQAKEQIYTQAGKPIKGSELERAESALLLASEGLTRATERVQKLDSEAVNLDGASRTLLATTPSLHTLEQEQEALTAKDRRLGELRQIGIVQFHDANAADKWHSALALANEQILEARVNISGLEKSLKPQNEVVTRLGKEMEEAKRKAAAAEMACRTATEAVRAARLRQELASTYAQLFAAYEDYVKLHKKYGDVAKLGQDLAGLESELAKLPKVDSAKLRTLHLLEREQSNAAAALRAMATGFEVIAADYPVKAGDGFINVGEKLILTEDTEVMIGSAVRLLIQPGGGNGLAAARRTEEAARKGLQIELDALGLPSIQEAVEYNARCEEFKGRIRAAQAELAGMGAENLAEELQNAANEYNAAQAGVERLAGMIPVQETPENKVAAKALAKELEKKLSDAEAQETGAKAGRARSTEKLESATESLKEAQVETKEQCTNLTGLKAQLELRLQTHGDDVARAKALLKSQSDETTTKGLLKSTTDAITAAQPELLEGDRARIERSIKGKTDERNAAKTAIAVARAALRSDGSEDPRGALVTAKAKADSAKEHRNSVHRKAQAVTLLDKLFQEEQRHLSAQFTQPLADKISGYLQCIFGAGARAQLELENNEFTGLRLLRLGFGEAPFAFDTLSGGAKEQTAAAVRLAMAEVLADDHGGCLPIVFDDAFAYSDPDRVNQLQRMLDLAATRGLQVIVLACNPADYAGLGGRLISLNGAHRVRVASSSMDERTVMDAEELEALDDKMPAPAFVPGVKATPDQKEQFLESLRSLGGSGGNITLRANLAWDEPAYLTVKGRTASGGAH